MTPIIAGIVTHWNVSGVAGPWLTGAADKSTYPYCVIVDNGGKPSQLFGSSPAYIKECNVRFTIYHNDEAVLRTHQAALHTRYDRAKFTLSSGRVLSCLRQNDRIQLGGFDKNNEAVYQAVSEYQILAQNT